MKLTGKYTTATIYADVIEPQCVEQIQEMIDHPAFTNPVAIMPDAHYGKGSCVGFTMELGDKVIPNVVGVDIGCGMEAWNLGNHSIPPQNYERVDNAIRAAVPLGFNVHSNAVTDYCPTQGKEIAERVGCKNRSRSIGTLGGGNHFIEIGLSAETGDLWVIIHSGSRNLGAMVCKYWQDRAEDNHQLRYNQEKRAALNGVHEKDRQKCLDAVEKLPIKGLEWLEGDDLEAYLQDMYYCQRYALANRREMAKQVSNILGLEPQETISSIHNFIDPKDQVIRKGACSAHLGERFVVPLNMRDGTLICEGKGVEAWNKSAPHGAGRTMSRKAAKSRMTDELFEETMKNVYHSTIALDEAPQAYKPADVIKQKLAETGEIVDRIVPILNIKG